MTSYFSNLTTENRVAIIIGIAIGVHVLVILLRFVVEHLQSTSAFQRRAKLRTLLGLVASTAVFIIYLVAIGLALKEFGISLTAYVASASVIGLAVGFGSQGVVQDIVTGVTVIFSDLLQVGDLVEISGQVGEVQSVGMRFTSLLNSVGAQVFIPNRTLTNVIIYPRGYLRWFADITLPTQPESPEEAELVQRIKNISADLPLQYPGILRAPIEVEGEARRLAERRFIRVKFRIWPGRSAPIENNFKQEILRMMKSIDANYADWMLSIYTEVNESPRLIRPFSRIKK